MADTHQIDLRAAINAISDVIQNRPLPLRNFDQIYVKAGDMVLQKKKTESLESYEDKICPRKKAGESRRALNESNSSSSPFRLHNI